MSQQPVAPYALSSYWFSAHPTISIFNLIGESSRFSRWELLKLRVRFICRTFEWDTFYGM
jgi:hypothetical protein